MNVLRRFNLLAALWCSKLRQCQSRPNFLLQDETVEVGCVLEQGTFEDCGKYMSG
jgi:hypothetical protein